MNLLEQREEREQKEKGIEFDKVKKFEVPRVH
jgi:hypothetical protein